MAGRFEDDEIDLLSSFPSVSSTPVTSNSTPSDPFSIYSDPVHGRSPRIFDRFESSSSSDDEFSLSASTPNCANHNGVAKKLDYMIQYLDRKLSKDNGNGDGSRPLPEFVGKGGGTGIFRLPCRAVVRPDRPPSVEVRPHPLRETQIGCSLRVILCTETQLWAGGESGVRYWNLSELYSVRAAGARGSGDEMAAPFVELGDVVAEVVCMVADEGNGVVWSGHRDGKIRCWRMDQRLCGNGFKECLSWQAHRWPVLSMVMTSYGDLWSGTENGAIKIWPWEAIEKSLSLPAEERHMAVLTVERSYIDLRSQVTINGVCYMFASDVKYLLSDHSTAKVWSAGIYSFALWNSRTRELLKVFNTDGQIENWVDFSSIQDLTAEDEVKMQFVAAFRKEKPQAVSGFLQRSRNAILGAADAVRRAAVKGACGDDNQRTEAMVITVDGVTWTGCSGGLLVQWDGNGNRLQEFQYHPFAVQCLCTYGSRIWVGYVSGTVLVLDLDGKWLGEWIAHSAPVVKMAVGAGYVFSLAGHGGIRGWSITSPGPVDSPLSLELTGKEFIYSRIENLKILAGTWNVGEGRASSDSLVSWLGGAASDVDIVVVGLQELEMGAGVLAMSAAKESVGMDSSAVGQWWLDMIGNILDEGSSFERIGSRQLAGLLIGVWVRNNDLRANVGDIDIAAVPCGFGRAIGNKGAVGLRMRVYDRVMCFVNCHFAAHLEAVNRRNADFDHVYRSMVFSRPSHVFNTAAAGISSAVQMLRGTNAVGVRSVEVVPELSEADLVIFLGDFNYRIDGISYDEVRDFISQRCFDWLRERDQLRAEMEAGNVFQGMREAIIRFPPTYKFEKHQPGLAGYDAGEKKRIPAWCDRILYRDSRSSALAECSLDCPVVCSISQYEACMDVTDSDHKPVRCILNVDIARVDESVRRQEFGEIMESNEKIRHVLQDLCRVPETVVSTNNIILQNDDTTILRITNRSGVDKAFYMIICEGQSTVKEDGLADNHCPRGSFGLPRWLEVNPAKGVIDPDRTVEISLHHEDFQTLVEFVDGVPRNCWCEDARDKEVILVVKIHGSCSTEVGYHRVRVRHCLSSKTKGIVIRPSAEPEPKKGQGNVLQRSNFQHLNSSLDVFDQLLNLHTP